MSDSIFDKKLAPPYSEPPPPPVNFDEFMKVVESRRSVRLYRDVPVPEDVVQKCIDVALLAPNSSNLQPWEFHWVRSPEPKKKLDLLCFNQPAARTAPVLIVAVARTKTWKENSKRMVAEFDRQGNVPPSAYAYYKKLVPIAYAVGPLGIFGPFKKLLLTIVGFFTPMARGPCYKSELRLWAEKSTALACENLMLAFRAAGYDSCPMEGFDEVRVAKLLKLPRDASVVMVVSAGKRIHEKIYGPRVRFDRSLFVKTH